MKNGFSRRDFLALTVASAGAVVLSRAQAADLVRKSGVGRGGKLLILGAGIAGLAAGLKLKEMGYEVTLLEGRTRPGGRVHTIREPFSDDLHAEAGAGRIPSTHALTLEYVKRYRLKLEPFYPQSGGNVFLWRGSRQAVPYGKHPDLTPVASHFTERERAVGFDGLSGLYFDRLREEVRALPPEGWPYPGMQKYKDVSYGDFLKAQGASEDAINALSTGFQEDSLLDFAHDATSHAVPMLWKIRGGNDRLPYAMANELRDQIRYGAGITRIEQDATGVRVSFVSGGRNHQLAAERVICTLPFTVLRGIELSPAVSAGKRRSIDNMYLGPVARVMVQTASRYWEQDKLNGFATVDQAMEIWSPTYGTAGRRGILMSYIYEDLAREYSALTADQQIERTLALYEQVHPGIYEQFETATTWSWLNEKYSRGAFLVTKAGQFDVLQDAATPEGRIHFAGEHTSPWPGWIQGALHSGLRTAMEISGAA